MEEVYGRRKRWISVDGELYRECADVGMDVQRICEKAMKEAVEKAWDLKGMETSIFSFVRAYAHRKKEMLQE